MMKGSRGERKKNVIKGNKMPFCDGRAQCNIYYIKRDKIKSMPFTALRCLTNTIEIMEHDILIIIIIIVIIILV